MVEWYGVGLQNRISRVRFPLRPPMRNAFAKSLAEAALADERIVVLAADISPAGPMADFAKEFPRRFINVGVAEQVMIGMAAGLALKGLKPFCYTIATFALYRPFEFIRDDLAYQGLPVTVVGMGSGLNYSTLGGTHQAIEDVAVASAIPGMQVLAPCDPRETEECVRWCAVQQNGPVYLRIGKSGESDLTYRKSAEPWEFGKLRKIKDGWPSVATLVYGPIAEKAYEGDNLYSCHTLKPLDRDGIETLLRRYQYLRVIEEHVCFLGDRVKAIAYEIGAKCQVHSVHLKDEFMHY